MLIGYARVSKADGSPSLNLQRDALIAAGVMKKTQIRKSYLGKKDYCPGFEACVKALRKGDAVAVWKLDRLGGNLKHLVNLVED